MFGLPYKVAGGFESLGHYSYGVKIEVAVPHTLTEEDERVICKAADEIGRRLYKSMELADPKVVAYIAEEQAKILGLFPEGCGFKKIPNEYYGEASNYPWFIVYTLKGPIKIGWRKSVINIEWGDSIIEADAQTLFPLEQVTKYEKLIHAWGYEKAQEYINKLLI